jgi:excinuclease ABC subunit C
MSSLSQKLKFLPQSPGVYIFKNVAGEVLYVGKAASLKDRVNSYFRQVGTGRDLSVRPIEMFISEVTDLEIRKTDTVLEAYILEQDLIKKLQPRYNMMSKDDRSFCYVVVTKEEWPRFVVLRKTEIDLSPFGKGGMKGGFEKQSKSDKSLSNSPFTKGRESKFSKVFGPYTSRRQIETVLKILRKIFPYHSRAEKSEFRCFDYHIGLCPGPYDNAISKMDYRKNIKAIQMILEGKKKGLINKMKKEMNRCSDKQDYECAAKLRNQMFALQHIQDIALITESKDAINRVSTKEMRIEAYDISNISGQYATGSMVVFDNTDREIQPNKDQYRKFRIKTIEGANDVGAMEEVLMRRFRNNWKLPNLIILDGGRGHLNMARRILRIYHLEIPLLAVAKGPTRKKLDFYSFGTLPKLPKNIIEQIRDEAHRFAIKYHRNLLRKLAD